MDFLHKPISNIDEPIYFLVSSVEEPYYFVRMQGIIRESTITDEVVTYRIQLTNILEPIDIIRQCIVGKHFRMKCIRRKTSPYKDLRIHGFSATDTDLRMIIINQLKKSYFDVSIMTTFTNEDVMNEKLSLVNSHNIDILTRRVEFLSKRMI